MGGPVRSILKRICVDSPGFSVLPVFEEIGVQTGCSRCCGKILVKIGAKVVSHDRYVTFQLAEVAVPRALFRKILRLIDDLRPRPAPV